LEELLRHSEIAATSMLVFEMPATSARARASENTWRVAAARNFAAIAALDAGWDGPHSKEISPATIYQAGLLLRDALESQDSSRAPYIIPRADGAVQLEWTTSNYELEFKLRDDGVRSFWLCNRNSGVEIEKEGEAATEFLFRWAKRVASETSDVFDVPIAPTAGQFLFAT
jgi:hypothetical protein